MSILTFLKEGNLEELKKIRIPNDPTFLTIACENGHLPIVKYLTELGISCTTWAFDLAAKNGRIDIVEYLHNHRTEGCTSWAVDLAAMNGKLDVVKWLLINRKEDGKFAIDLAAKNGKKDVVIYLLNYIEENKTNMSVTSEAIDWALLNNHYEIARYLIERNYPYTIDRVKIAVSLQKKEIQNISKNINFLEGLTSN